VSPRCGWKAIRKIGAGTVAFSVGKSQAATLVRYIQNQADHHRRVSFQEEFRQILRRYEIAFDERYLWD
jgi:putative transposase